jgi:hypothetical protein
MTVSDVAVAVVDQEATVIGIGRVDTVVVMLVVRVKRAVLLVTSPRLSVVDLAVVVVLPLQLSLKFGRFERSSNGQTDTSPFYEAGSQNS